MKMAKSGMWRRRQEAIVPASPIASARKDRWPEMKFMFYPVALCAALWGMILGVGFFLDDKVPWTHAQLLAQFDFTRHLFADHELEDIVLDCDDNVVTFTYPNARYEELAHYFDNGPWKKAPGGGCAVYLQEGCMVVLDRGTMLIKSSSVGMKSHESPQK